MSAPVPLGEWGTSVVGGSEARPHQGGQAQGPPGPRPRAGPSGVGVGEFWRGGTGARTGAVEEVWLSAKGKARYVEVMEGVQRRERERLVASVTAALEGDPSPEERVALAAQLEELVRAGEDPETLGLVA